MVINSGTRLIPDGICLLDPLEELSILRDFKNSPIYIHCFFHNSDSKMFPLSPYKMDHYLP